MLGTLVESPRLDATLCFADTRDEDKAELWDGGDVGGFECYIAAEDDTDADATAEVYKAEKDGDDENEDGDLLSVQAGCNVLNIVMRDEGVMKFVKYVSHKAPSRYDVFFGAEYCESCAFDIFAIINLYFFYQMYYSS
jgi:hypothetical protein